MRMEGRGEVGVVYENVEDVEDVGRFGVFGWLFGFEVILNCIFVLD